MHVDLSSMLWMVPVALIVAGCESPPDDPFERFLYDFELLTDTLFEHMENADEVMEGKLSVSG